MESAKKNDCQSEAIPVDMIVEPERKFHFKKYPPAKLAYSTENWDLGDPVVDSYGTDTSLNFVPHNMTFPACTKVVFIQNCQSFNM